MSTSPFPGRRTAPDHHADDGTHGQAMPHAHAHSAVDEEHTPLSSFPLVPYAELHVSIGQFSILVSLFSRVLRVHGRKPSRVYLPALISFQLYW